MKVKDCMCHNIVYVEPECTVKDCAKLMSDKHIGCIPVCDCNQNIVGLITDRDIILRTVACDKSASNTKVSDIMTSKVCSCDLETDIDEAGKIMSDNQIRRLPVIDQNKVVGIITLGNLSSNPKVDTKCVCETLENICNCDRKNAE